MLRVAMIALLLFLGPVSGHAPAAEEEWVRTSKIHLPGLEPRDGAGNKSVVSVRLVREPEDRGYVGRVVVPHGTASYHTEESHPTATGSRLLARGTGDEWGFVNVVKPGDTGPHWESGFHWHFEAAGHGGRHETGYFRAIRGKDIRLPGGVDREVLVVDPFGRPFAGARVSFYLGCPHSPEYRSGVTDDRGVVGLANLPLDRDEDFWVEAPGVHRGPYALTPPFVGQPRPTILLQTARTARGRVADEAGAPLAGIVVRTTGYPRGPIALTNERGEFVLDGLARGRPIRIYRSGSPYPDCIVSDFEEAVPLRVTLRKGRPTSLTDGLARHLVIVETSSDASVVLSRLSDGFTVRGKAVHGRFRTEVPEGRYRIVAGGGFSWNRANSVETTLPRPDGENVRVPLTEKQATLYAEQSSGWRRGPSRVVEMRIPGRTKDVSDWTSPSLPRRPTGVPTGLLLSNPARILPVEGYRVKIPAVLRNEIRFRLVDTSGAPVEPETVWVNGLGGEEVTPVALGDGRHAIRTWWCGRTWLSFEGPFPEWWVEGIELPTGKAGTVDLGTLVVPDDGAIDAQEPWTFRLLHADGTAVPKDESVHSHIATSGPEPRGWDGLAVDDEGTFTVEHGAPSIRFQIRSGRIYPFATTIDRDGSREVRLPAGRLTGVIRGSDGQPAEAVLYIGAYRFDAPAGRIDVRALPPGPHVVIAGVRGHLTEVRRIVLKAGETRSVDVRLKAR